MAEQKPGFFQRVRNWAWNPNYAQSYFSESELRKFGQTVGFKDWETFTRLYNLDSVGNVGVEQGMRLTDVYTCINILSQSIAWLPKSLKRRSEKTGTQTVSQNPLNSIVSLQPNTHMSAYNYWTKVGVDMWGWGNHYSIIQNRTDLNNLSLLPIEPWEVTPEIQRSGDLIYKYKGEDIPSHEMLHFRLFTRDGINGISPIRQNASLMGFALRQEEYSHNVIGTAPVGILSSDIPLDNEVKKQGSKAFKDKILSGDIPILDRLKYTKIGIPPNEAQYLETARFSTQRTYGIYRVPPIFGQDYENANFANSEQQNLVFVQHALMPPVTNIEQELKIKLLPTGSQDFFHVQTNALLRGDTNTRKEFYQTLLTLGVFSPKRVLDLEDEPWTEDDDVKYIQGAMVPVKNIGDFQNQNGQAVDLKALRKLVKLNGALENGQN